MGSFRLGRDHMRMMATFSTLSRSPRIRDVSLSNTWSDVLQHRQKIRSLVVLLYLLIVQIFPPPKKKQYSQCQCAGESFIDTAPSDWSDSAVDDQVPVGVLVEVKLHKSLSWLDLAGMVNLCTEKRELMCMNAERNQKRPNLAWMKSCLQLHIRNNGSKAAYFGDASERVVWNPRVSVYVEPVDHRFQELIYKLPVLVSSN